MKKYLIFLLLIGLKFTVFAQTISDFHTELENIDISNVVLEYQDKEHKMRDSSSPIIITNVVFHKHAQKYFVYGFIKKMRDDSGPFKGLVYGISIWDKRYGSLVYTITTTRNGLFSISLDKNEKATFNMERYIDLHLKSSN